MTSEIRLFRKPRRPKLEKIQLDKLKNSLFENEMVNISISETNSTLSTDREIINPNYINAFKLPYIAGTNSKNKLIVISEENNIPIPKNSFKSLSESSFSSNNESSLDTVFNERPPKYQPNMRTIMSSAYQDRDCDQSRKSIFSVLKPNKVSGPDPLPQRPLKLHKYNMADKKAFYDDLTYENDYLDPDEIRRKSQNYFELNDFFAKESYNENLIDFCCEKVSVSTHNYVKLSKLLSERIQFEKSSKTNKVFNNYILLTKNNILLLS